MDDSIFRQNGSGAVPRGVENQAVDASPSDQSGGLSVTRPVWQKFVTTSLDFSLRGLLIPAIDSVGIACVIIIARTRNPLVDGEPPTKVEVTNKPSNPVPTDDVKEQP